MSATRSRSSPAAITPTAPLTLPFWQPVHKNVPRRFARLSQVAAYSCRELLDRRPAVPSALSIEVDSGQDGQHQALSAVRPHSHDDLGVFCERVRERHPVCVIEPNQCAGAAASYGYHPRYQKYRERVATVNAKSINSPGQGGSRAARLVASGRGEKFRRVHSDHQKTGSIGRNDRRPGGHKRKDCGRAGSCRRDLHRGEWRRPGRAAG
jgi:hypothetical protein